MAMFLGTGYVIADSGSLLIEPLPRLIIRTCKIAVAVALLLREERGDCNLTFRIANSGTLGVSGTSPRNDYFRLEITVN